MEDLKNIYLKFMKKIRCIQVQHTEISKLECKERAGEDLNVGSKSYGVKLYAIIQIRPKDILIFTPEQ